MVFRLKSKIQNFFLIKIHERIFENRLQYLYFSEKKNDSLLVLFTGFANDDKKRKYNYVRGLKSLKKVDRLYVNDNFGFRGSYNLFENGENGPELMTKRLIENVLKKGNYSQLYFAGSSKGGTCALYFGLEFEAKEIYVGACQYNIGTYLSKDTRQQVLTAMMGERDRDESIYLLNRVMPTIIEKHRGQNTRIGILYSKKDLTYERQLVDLMNKLKECGLSYEEQEVSYEKHEQVGIPFLMYLLSRFQ